MINFKAANNFRFIVCRQLYDMILMIVNSLIIFLSLLGVLYRVYYVKHVKDRGQGQLFSSEGWGYRGGHRVYNIYIMYANIRVT